MTRRDLTASFFTNWNFKKQVFQIIASEAAKIPAVSSGMDQSWNFITYLYDVYVSDNKYELLI